MITDKFGKKYYTTKECSDLISKFTNGEIDLSDSGIHRLMLSYKKNEGIIFYKINHKKVYKVDTFNNFLYGRRRYEFLERANEIFKKENHINDNVHYQDYDMSYKNDENDMEKYNNNLLKSYQTENVNSIKNIVRESINNFIRLDEINHIAENSPITVCSLNDFVDICTNLGINDSNVENYIGKICFIEIGSCDERARIEYSRMKNRETNYNRYTDENDFVSKQFYFKENHANVIRETFDDSNRIGTKSNLRLLNYHGSEYQATPFDYNISYRLVKFIRDNISSNNDGNIKFIIHCWGGKSRSASIGYFIASKLKLDIEKYLDEYLVPLKDGSKSKTRHSQFKLKKNRYGGEDILNPRVLNRVLDTDERFDEFTKNGIPDESNETGNETTTKLKKKFMNHYDYLKNYINNKNLK